MQTGRGSPGEFFFLTFSGEERLFIAEVLKA